MKDQRRSILPGLVFVVGGGRGVVSIAENLGRLPGGRGVQTSPRWHRELIRHKMVLTKLSWQRKQHEQRDEEEQQHESR